MKKIWTKDFGNGTKIEVNLEELLPIVATFAILYGAATVVTLFDYCTGAAGSSIWDPVFWGGLTTVHSALMVAIMIALDEDKEEK